MSSECSRKYASNCSELENSTSFRRSSIISRFLCLCPCSASGLSSAIIEPRRTDSTRAPRPAKSLRIFPLLSCFEVRNTHRFDPKTSRIFFLTCPNTLGYCMEYAESLRPRKRSRKYVHRSRGPIRSGPAAGGTGWNKMKHNGNTVRPGNCTILRNSIIGQFRLGSERFQERPGHGWVGQRAASTADHPQPGTSAGQ